jgi:4'-phosphopantetheinyl transferase
MPSMIGDDTGRLKASIEWPSAPAGVSMQAGTVHIWAWDFECSFDELQRYIAVLSVEECARMERFHFEKDRRRFAVSHAILRILLGRYLDLPTSSISFEQNEFGKPHLVPASAAGKITFNLTHTTRVGLLAIATDLVVGVDVEEMRPIDRGLAEHYFSAQEQTVLRTLAGNDWLEGFYNCWTRKEAILKAEGVGLNASLDAFDVSLIPNARAALLGVRIDAGLTRHWHLEDLRPASGFVGALATDAAPAGIHCYRFET